MKAKNKDSLISDIHVAFSMLEDPDEARRFLIDLCTPGEIEAFAERFAIARALARGEKGYREIAADIGASTTTVARVARFLNQERHGGYKLIISRIKN